LIVASLFIIVPFLFWYGTWYGRGLSDSQIEEQLSDTQHPRKVQHALTQISERIERGDEQVKRWYPKVIALAGDPTPQIRMTAAWVMGQDNRSQEFHDTLLRLLSDTDPLVRRNSALGLVRFGDSSGRPELGMMLRPYTVRAEGEGIISIALQTSDSEDEQETVGTGTLLAHIKGENGQVLEVRSPMPGYLKSVMVKDGSKVAIGSELLLISPEPKQVLDALRGLYFVGEMEDIPDVEVYTRTLPHMGSQIQQQAELTAKAIRSRSEGKAQQ
jgi:hypothetical protein